jgi:hypothetical protein
MRSAILTKRSNTPNLGRSSQNLIFRKNNLAFIMRTLCILCTVVIYNLELFNTIVTAGIIFSLNILTYIFCLYFPTFYSKSASKFLLMQSFVVFWISAWLFLTLMTNGLLDNSFLAFIACLPMIYLVFYFKNPIDDLKVVLRPFDEIFRANELIDKLEGMRYYITTRNIFKSSDLMTEKILSASHDYFTLEERFDLFAAAKARNCDRYIITERSAQMNFINSVYIKGLKKYDLDNQV